jgi:hypothetical protein
MLWPPTHATFPRDLAVDHHDLAVIPEIELETVAWALSGMELVNFDPRGAELVDVRTCEVVAADLVVQESHANSGPGPLDQVGLELAADSIVVDDVVLDQDVLPRGINALEDALEHGVPVHEELHGISTEVRDSGQTLSGQGDGVDFRVLDHERGNRSQRFLRDAGDFLQVSAAGACIALEVTPSQNPVGRHGHIGEGNQRYRPGDRSLLGAGRHDRVHTGDNPQHIEHDDSEGDHASFPSLFETGGPRA